MKKSILILSVLAAFGFCVPLSALTLKEVRIEKQDKGPLDESFVRAFTSLRAGQTIENEAELNAAVARDVDNLRRSERFSYVRAFIERTGEDYSLVYSVSPRMRLRNLEVVTDGSIRSRRVRQQLELKPGDFVDEALIGEKARKAEAYCRKNKFPDASVSWVLTPDETLGTVDVKIIVNEGSRMRVTQINFEGDRFASDSSGARIGRFFKQLVPYGLRRQEERTQQYVRNDLRREMKQRETWWITPWFGAYHPEFKEADMAAIRNFYRNRGYLDVVVEAPDLVSLGRGALKLNFIIVEGIQYRIGTIDFDGITLFDRSEIEGQVRLAAGNIASQADIDAAADAITRFYGNRGYIRNYVTPQITTDPETKTANIRFNVHEGVPAVINEVIIRGNEKTKDTVMRRELAVYPGEQFHQQRIETSENRLRNLGFFETVSSSYDESGGATTNAYDLTFKVKEKPTGSFLVGAGFSSVDNLIGFAELSQGNFDLFNWPPIGGGQKMKLRMQVGTKRNDVEVSFVEPWFMHRQLAFGVDLYHREASYFSDKYDLTTTGGRLSLTKPLGTFTRGSISYSLERFKIDDVASDAPIEIRDEADEGSRLKSTVGLTITRDSRDQFYIPTRGNFTSAKVEYSGGPFGADTDIYLLELRSSHFWSIGDHVFNLKGAISTVDSHSGGKVSVFDRLYLGGPRTVRAFKYRNISPRSRSDEDEPIGGYSSWYLTAEYTVPLWNRIRGAIFYDIGAVSGDTYDFFDKDNINSGFGVGVRLDLPMFPIRLDYAIPHIKDDRNDSGGGRFNFLIGYTF